MSEQWFYVEDGQRQGPIGLDELQSMMSSQKINGQTYVWTKGFDNWVKAQDIDELKSSDDIPAPISDTPFSISTVNEKDKIFFIKTGADRGQAEVEYGPFNLITLIKLFNENRINEKTFTFVKGQTGWQPLGDMQGYQEAFHAAPPVITEDDRRAFKRKPLIARMFIQNNNQVFEGICRDLSIGGMQVLVDNFPANSGDRISINVHPDNLDHHFVASGEVVRVLEGGLGFSFRFINLSDESLSSINNYIAHEG